MHAPFVADQVTKCLQQHVVKTSRCALMAAGSGPPVEVDGNGGGDLSPLEVT
ncbi:MAG: hypothetical protein ACJ76U_05190 [Gaiellaceae bacterium]|jgi:hypothetical protein